MYKSLFSSVAITLAFLLGYLYSQYLNSKIKHDVLLDIKNTDIQIIFSDWINFKLNWKKLVNQWEINIWLN